MKERKPFYCDIDDTLLMHDLSSYPDLQHITLEIDGRKFTGAVNQKNVNIVKSFYGLGRDVYFWSGTGAYWAKAVADALNLSQYAANAFAFLPKPTDYYLDDKDASYWMGKRIWRDPLTGKEGPT
jgi:hydroxymethylpyrimidine pyrophosphatase-like HAD family hydrolase